MPRPYGMEYPETTVEIFPCGPIKWLVEFQGLLCYFSPNSGVRRTLGVGEAMSLSSDTLTSKRLEVTGTIEDAIELCYRQGWTDGLPVIPPTEEKVMRFLDYAGRHPSDVIGVEPVRGRVITAEKIAINALMAGCLAEYMPVVIAAVECMVQPEFSLHGSSASTGGSAPLLVINGPIRQRLGFASGHNLFGPGPDRRTNATVGRAIRLLLINVLENHPGVLDRSTLGHPGKYSYCIAEDEENSPWEPLHVERGFPSEASTVTVFAALGPSQVDLVGAGTPEMVLTAVADSMLAFGRGHGEILLIMAQEHGGFIKEADWSKAQVRDFLFQKARRSAGEWAAIHKAEVPAPGTESEMVPVCRTPESVVLLAGGGSGGPWSALIPRWSKGVGSHSVIREIDTSRIP